MIISVQHFFFCKVNAEYISVRYRVLPHWTKKVVYYSIEIQTYFERKKWRWILRKNDNLAGFSDQTNEYAILFIKQCIFSAIKLCAAICHEHSVERFIELAPSDKLLFFFLLPRIYTIFTPLSPNFFCRHLFLPRNFENRLQRGIK